MRDVDSGIHHMIILPRLLRVIRTASDETVVEDRERGYDRTTLEILANNTVVSTISCSTTVLLLTGV